MRNGWCYRHGGASTGPRTPEGLQRIVKARTVHGARSRDAGAAQAGAGLRTGAKRLVELT